MLNYESLFLFIFVFSFLVVLRTLSKFIGTLLLKEPKPILLSNRELITIGLSLSYIITFIIKK